MIFFFFFDILIIHIKFILLIFNILSIHKSFLNEYKFNSNSNQLILDNNVNNDQGYHPKVISFSKFFNGYKYWIAYTPYPKGDQCKENPVINASNDLIHWVSPLGISNPLDVPIISNAYSYNSDTHLLFNEDTQELEIYWR